MSTSVTAHFDVTGWDEAPYDEPADAPRLARATVTKTFRGDLKGESTAEVLLCQRNPSDLSAGGGYIASERFSGRLGEREGTFVLQHGGLGGAGTAPRTFGHIVPGSGTGDLAGLHGEVEIQQDADGNHTLVLDYEIAG
jgi:hypothetical protein